MRTSHATARTAALVALVLVASLAGCGGSSPTSDPRSAPVVAAVQAFAGATGPPACDMLTPAAVAHLYGSRAGCVARSGDFQPGQVKVESVTFTSGGTRAVAQARSLGGRRRFTVVTLLVAPPGCRTPCPQAAWRIDSVKPR